MHLTGLLPEIVRWLSDVELTMGRHSLSLWVLLSAAFWVAMTLLLALWAGAALEVRLMRAEGLHSSLRVVFARLGRAGLLTAAVLIVLPLMGVDLTVLSVFGGALGVGIGFGLQKIASNYISGFIILLDHSVKIGDIVTIEKHSGLLNKMTARYVVVRGADGTEALIPNETVITSTVINHSYSDTRVCVTLPVQIGYNSDPEVATRLLIEAARAQPRTLETPEPRVLITSFGDNGINLELGVWIRDPELGGGALRSDIYYAIWRSFKANGIEIPFPQREVRLLGTPPAGV
jgi:small-conductance mechanosensitive channel